MVIQLSNKGYQGYAPSDDVLQEDTTEYSAGTTGATRITGTVLHEVALNSKLRFKCEMYFADAGGGPAYIYVRMNGSTIITWDTTNGAYTAKSEDVAFEYLPGDELTVFLQCPGGGANKTYMKNFQICGKRSPIILT